MHYDDWKATDSSEDLGEFVDGELSDEEMEEIASLRAESALPLCDCGQVAIAEMCRDCIESTVEISSDCPF